MKIIVNDKIMKNRRCCRRRYHQKKHAFDDEKFFENDFVYFLTFLFSFFWRHNQTTLMYDIWVEILWRCRRRIRKTTICSTTKTNRKIWFWHFEFDEKNDMSHNSRRKMLNVYISWFFVVNWWSRYFVWWIDVKRFVHFTIKRFQHKKSFSH